MNLSQSELANIPGLLARHFSDCPICSEGPKGKIYSLTQETDGIGIATELVCPCETKLDITDYSLW